MIKQYMIQFHAGTPEEALAVLGAAGVVAITVMPGEAGVGHFDVVITAGDMPSAIVALKGSTLVDAWSQIVEAEAVNAMMLADAAWAEKHEGGIQ